MIIQNNEKIYRFKKLGIIVVNCENRHCAEFLGATEYNERISLYSY